MTRWHLVHGPSGRTVAVVSRADTWLSKGWGVLGRRTLAVGDGLWLPGVASVHTVGVWVPLDLLFLDNNLQTVRSIENVPPGRWLVRAGGASHTLELGSGTLALLGRSVETGDVWQLKQERA